jgi:predicted amidophosphoribosyltransferase
VTDSVATPERDDKSFSSTEVCSDCGEAVDPSARFCLSCGVLQRRHKARVVSQRVGRVADGEGTDGPVCFACGEKLDPEKARFCRGCGQALQEAEQNRSRGLSASRKGGTRAQGPGLCHGCDAPLPVGQKFCATCGTASRLARMVPSEMVANDPGWYRVVKGLGLVFEGHLTLVVAAISATAVVTVLGLFGASWSQLAMVRAALLGAATLAAVVGLALAVVGEVICLSAPAESKVRVPTLVTLCIGAVSALLGIVALALMGSAGFDPARFPTMTAGLVVAALVLFVARLVAFSTLLRQMAFALQHYRIAQGSVGFIVFIGVGLAVVGMINLLFQSARPAAQTFAQLLAVAFALGVVFWYLNIVKRSRDLVRQRLP